MIRTEGRWGLDLKITKLWEKLTNGLLVLYGLISGIAKCVGCV